MILDFNKYNKNEKYNDIFNAKEIYIILYNKSELDLFLKEVDLNHFKKPSYIIDNDIIIYPLYLFINIDTLVVTYANTTHMEEYNDITKSDIFDYVWNKKLTISDIPKIKNIIKYRCVNCNPEYNSKEKPKRILENKINEGYFFDDNNGILNFINKTGISIPNIKIDDFVYLKTNYINILIKSDKKLSKKAIIYLKENSNKKFKILEKYKSNTDNNDEWWSRIDIYDREEIWVFDELLLYEPNYKPKEKPKRILENNKYKHKSIVIRVNDDNDLLQLRDFFLHKKYRVKNFVGQIKTFPNYMFIEDFNNIEDNHMYITYLSNNPSYEKLLNYIDKDQKIYNINQLNLVYRIIQNGNDEPIYEPKQKINRVLESFKNLNDNYNYNCIVIKVDNMQEYNYIYKKLKNLNINTVDIDYLKEDIESGNKCYIRIYMEYDNVLYSSGSKIENLELYSKDSGFKYDKIYNTKDIREQTLINILKYGADKPFYLPKQKINRILESNEYRYSSIVFKINDENENIIAQENLFQSGFYWNSKKQLRIFNNNEYPIYLFADNEQERSLSFMTDNNTYVMDYIKRCNTNDGERICEKIFNFDDTKYVIQLLKLGDYKPTYKSKQKINRIIESNNFDIEYIKKMLNKAPYDVILYRHHNNEQYYNKLNEILKKYPFFNKGYAGDIDYYDMFGKYYLFTLKNVDNWEQLNMYETVQENETIIEDYPNIKFSEMIVNPYHLDKILSSLIIKKPNYEPNKKSNRILENNELITESWEFCNNEYKLKKIINTYNASYPIFKIGDRVMFKKNALQIHLSDIRGIYDLQEHQKQWINKNSINKEFFKITNFAYWKDKDLWLLEVDNIDYISMNACYDGPDYNPKQKINRIL